jgi:membrane protease subunit HflC
MNKIIRVLLIVVAVALVLVLINSFFILPEGRQAVITQFGRPVGEPVTEAGLHFKTPFIQHVTEFEKRILIWDGDPNQVPTNDKTYVYLDVTARWRITDPLVFLQAINNTTRAMSILDDVIDGMVRDLVNKNNLVEIIRSSDWVEDELTAGPAKSYEPIQFGRDKITAMIKESASRKTTEYGIELIDVMFKRVNYIDTVRLRVYDRMISERKRIAAEKRSLGEGQKAEIMGKVQRELKEITSNANREAQEIKGKADAEAAAIYAAAYNQAPEFFAFSKSLESYHQSIGNNSRLIISSNSPFYRYLKEIE